MSHHPRVHPVTMLGRLSLAAVACAGVGCASGGWHHGQSLPELTQQEQAAATLDAFHQAAARADEVAYFGLLTDDAVFLGTDPAERWSKEQFRQWSAEYFARESAWTYEAIERHITIAQGGGIAWFDEVVRNATYGDLRGTGVLIRNPQASRGTREHAWLIAQYNLTFMVPNDLADEYLELVRRHPAP